MNETDESTLDAATPQFGLIDLVDAFTAFRHDFRTQVKESRATNEALQELSRQVTEVVGGLQQVAAGRVEDNVPASVDTTAQVAMTLIDFDIQWTRAVDAAVRYGQHIQKRQELPAQTFADAVAGLSTWQRWLAKPLIKRYQAIVPTTDENASAMTDGLVILLSRLRQVLTDYQIERIDTLGQPFDAELMRSIGSVDDATVPAGHVAQQIAPGYRRHGKVIRYADVRVASSS
jgi:molecular chaperone GrpE